MSLKLRKLLSLGSLDKMLGNVRRRGNMQVCLVARHTRGVGGSLKHALIEFKV